MPEEKIIFKKSTTGHYKELFKQKNILLGAHNFNEGEEMVAVIERIEDGVIKDKVGKDIEINVLCFTNQVKMTLNISNAGIISGLYGKYTGWKGKAVQIYVGKVRNPSGGAQIDGVKIRERIPDTGIAGDEVDHEKELRACKTESALLKAWEDIPLHIQPRFNGIKNGVRKQIEGAK